MSRISERIPTPPALVIAAHCSTIKRKAKHLDANELSSIFDDIVWELNTKQLRVTTYLNSLNEIVKILNSTLPPILPTISSHYIFILIRNTIRNLLQQLSQSKRLNDQEIYVLRNCVLLLDHLIEKIPDVSKVLHWITDVTFIDALAGCLNRMDKIAKKERNKHAVKQITRLLNIFCLVQERLPLDLHQTLFVGLLQPTMNCLTSSNYIKLFENFNSNTKSLTENQKLYLIKCPYFLTTYSGPHIEQAMERVLETMLPRYVSILDKHIKTITQWQRPIMRAIHNLIITIVYAEGYFSSYAYTESFRSLINHLLTILSEPTLINKIHPNTNNIETLLIDATLVVFNVLIYESNALDYIKQRKSTQIFRQLTKTPYETIVLSAYMMLAYTIDENDIKASSSDLTQLLSTTLNLLKRTITTREQMNSEQNIDRSILQLLETLKGLAQHEQIRSEISKQDSLEFLIHSYKNLQGLSKQVLLECLWTLSFNEHIAQQLREHPQFLLTLQNLPKPINDNLSTNALRRSNSYSSRRNSTSAAVMEATNYGIQKVADGLLWKIVKEPQFREKMKKQIETNSVNDQRKYKYDIMISSSYADRDIVQKIQQFLTSEGYNIWSERDHGQAMEIVAEAIENSEIVIICMSDSYKRDSHCQAQAEYAMISKKLLFPLVVHDGYKPDGWLSALVRNHPYFNLGASNFKAASEVLLKEIKQRQYKEKTPDFKQAVSTSVNTEHHSSIPLTNSDKPAVSVESSVSNGATGSIVYAGSSVISNGQPSVSTHSYSRSPAPSTSNSATPAIIGRQQQQQGSVRSPSRSITPGSIYTVAPITVFKQQQQVPIQPTFLPAVSSSISSATPLVVDKQQQPTGSMHPISRPTTPGVAPSSASTTITQQQQQPTVQSISRSSTPGIADKQQQQTSTDSILRSATADSISSAASTIVNQQSQQQMTVQPAVRVSTPSSVSSDPSVTARIRRHHTPTHPVPGLLIPASIPSAATVDADKQQQQQKTMNSILNLSTSNVIPSNASIHIEKNQPEQQLPGAHTVPSAAYAVVAQRYSMHPDTRLLTNGTTSSATSTAADKQQQQQLRLRLASRSPTTSSISSNETIRSDKQQQKVQVPYIPQVPTANTPLPATSTASTQHQPVVQSNSKTTVPNSIAPVASTIDNKQQQQQQQQTSVYSTPKSSIHVSANIEKQQQQSSRSNSRPTTPASSAPAISVNIEKQQRQPSRSNSRPTTPASGVPLTSNGIEKQQQQRVLSRPNSRSTTPATMPSGSSTNLASFTTSQTNIREQVRLPGEYINRKTQNSIYRTLSIDVWRNSDVLDFLFDTHLYTMMPLCESMSGKAFVRLFRMCQRKPSRLYDQLNEELRVRFKGITLPMGAYTQFLIEMDALVGPSPNALPPILDSTPKVVERVILMPSTVQKEQPISVHPSPRPSIGSTISSVSSIHSNTATPDNTISATNTPHNTRFVERAVYRPASNVGRPYNFIIESVEEPTVLLDQVQRYGNQLLLLDATAHQHRAMQSHS